jgi:uncharacterized protein YndB with AHSA1/START domain
MAESAISSEVDAGGFTIVREYEASREQVWAEWTTPEAFADWFGGTASEVPVSTVTMDVRPGGAWAAMMYAGPARHEIQWEGEYVDLLEPTLLVLTMTDVPGEDPGPPITVVLTDLGGGRTEMLLRQRGGMSREGYGRAAEGWGTFLDRMADRLAEAG